MYYYVKNNTGNVSDVTQKLYEERKKDPEYECWTEDPYSEDKLPEDVKAITYPNHTGGGWYELSDGSKVRGKQDAIQAQNNLD